MREFGSGLINTKLSPEACLNSAEWFWGTDDGRTTLLCGAGHARANEKDEDEQKVEIKDLSADVQKTIQDYLAGGNVTRVVKDSENGKTFYGADVLKPGGEKVEIKVAEDGKLVGECV